MNPTHGRARRSFLFSAGVAVASIGLGRRALGTELPTQDAASPAMPHDPRSTLEILLERYRRHQRTGLYAGRPAGGNHIPMALTAAWRLGASAEQLEAYVGHFHLQPEARPLAVPTQHALTQANWKEHLGRASFLEYAEYFERRIRECSPATVLAECMPVLARGLGAAFSHELLRLSFGLESGSTAEIAFALASWASGHRPTTSYDATAASDAPEAVLASIVDALKDVELKPDGGNSGPIAFRTEQVYGSDAFRRALRPVRVSESAPLDEITALTLRIFTQTQDFTLLHGFTTCQALRRVLPYVDDPRPCVDAFWHSFCASYVTAQRFKPCFGQDAAPTVSSTWKELFAAALAAEQANVSSYEHTLKLTHSAWTEAQHSGRDGYLAVAAREIRQPSRFV